MCAFLLFWILSLVKIIFMDVSLKVKPAWLEVLLQPKAFFVHLKSEPPKWLLPCLMLFLAFVLATFIPLVLGELTEPNLLAQLLTNAIAWLVFLGFSVLFSGQLRTLEVLGFAIMPVLLAMILTAALWFFGDAARTVTSILMLLTFFLGCRLSLIGITILTGQSGAAWRTVLLAPLLTFLIMALPFGLLVRWLGLA